MTNAANVRPPSTDQNILTVNLDGGLNTVSSSLNVPLGDSPILNNVEINQAGNLQTREGSQWLQDLSNSSAIGFCALPYKTKAGYSLLVAKDKTDIDIFEIVGGSKSQVSKFELVMTKAGVWPATAANIKFDHVITNEPNSRIVMTTGISVPVQLQFFETSKQVSSGSAIANFTLASGSLQYATASNIIVWVNGVRVAISSTSFSSGTLTVTFTSALAAGTYFIDFCFISWQWLAEAALLSGRRLYQPQTRFSTDSGDLSVAIPVDLLRTFDSLDKAAFNIIPYRSSAHAAYYTYKTNYQPQLVSEFNFSQGITYKASDNRDVVPGISHVTFGVLPASPEEVHFVKAEVLPFNGGAGASGNNIIVLVDDVVATQNTSNTTASGSWGATFYLRNTVSPVGNFYGNSSIVTSGSTVATFISFDATTSVGLPYSALVKIINKASNGFAGSGATSNYDGDFIYRDGSLFPVYGMSEWADYAAGSFPRTVELCQGRLVFGGFPNKPLYVTFSNTLDSAISGVFFNDFTVAGQDGESTDAVAVFVTSVDNDSSITAIVTFTSSLFVFTKNKIVRLFGGSGGITPTNIISSVIASVGALNSRCVASVDSSVLFLGTNGLYQLAPSLQVGDFQVRPQSTKIVDLLQNINNQSVAWISYDRNNNKLYAGVTNDERSLIATKMYCLSLFREAWWEMSMFYGSWYTSHGIVVETLNQTFLVFSNCRKPRQNDAAFELASFPYFYSTDITKTETSTLSTVSFPLAFLDTFTFVPNADILQLSFSLLSVETAVDVAVRVDNVAQLYLRDFIKTSSNTVLMTKTLDTGSAIAANPVNPNTGKYPVMFHMDNVEQDDWTAVVGANSVDVTIGFTNVDGTVKRYGYVFPSIAASPVLARQTISRGKTLRHLYVLLFNKNYRELFLQEDLNAAVQQAAIDLVGNRKRSVGLSVAISLERSSFKFNTNQVYPVLYYDVGRYDIGAPVSQSGLHTKLGFDLRGISTIAQVLYYSFSRVWEICAYELVLDYTSRSTKNGFD